MIPKGNQLNHIMRNGISVVRAILKQADHRLGGMEEDLNQLQIANCKLQIEYIILHHSLTQDGKTVSWDAIRRFHTDELKWRDIGYHFGIELIGDHYEILTGRMMNEAGAHCKQYQMNQKSLGVCFVGNFDLEEPPQEQWNLGIKLVKCLLEVLEIPKSNVRGHREYAPYKSCPGKMFDLEKFAGEL